MYESFEFMCSILVDTHKHAPSNRTQTSDLDVKNNWSARLDLKILSMSNRWSTCIFQYVFNIESYLVIYWACFDILLSWKRLYILLYSRIFLVKVRYSCTKTPESYISHHNLILRKHLKNLLDNKNIGKTCNYSKK